MFNHKNHTFLIPAHLGRRYPVNGIFAYQNKTADKICGKSVGIIWFHYFLAILLVDITNDDMIARCVISLT